MENNKLNELKAQIEVLTKKQILSNSPEERMLISDQINALREQCRTINRKNPSVTPVINAATIGDKMEARLNGKRSPRSFGQSRIRI